MYQTKPALPETTRAAEPFGARQGDSPGGSRMVSIILFSAAEPNGEETNL
jgi:hypothetical protein